MDKDGIYLAGELRGTATIPGMKSPYASKGGSDALIVSFTLGGADRWSRAFGSAIDDRVLGIDADGKGKIYATGSFGGSVSIGAGSITSKGSSDIYVASLSSDGKTVHWAKGYGSTTPDSATGIAVAGGGDLYITGPLYGKVDFGGGLLSHAGLKDVFVASFNSTGGHRWSRGFGTTKSENGHGIAVDAAGNVYLTGSVSSPVDFGGGPVQVVGGESDVLVASFTSKGSHRWARVWGGGSIDLARGIATHGSSLCVTGDYTGGASFGGPPPHREREDPGGLRTQACALTAARVRRGRRFGMRIRPRQIPPAMGLT